jgi:nucleoside-diphosphate-sugar epimerase
MKALVTGGCGFIGSHLTNRLVEEGNTVDVVDNLSGGDLSNLTCKWRSVLPGMIHLWSNQQAPQGEALVITGDFADREILERVASGMYDVVYHVAANPRVPFSVKDPVQTHEDNTFKSIALFKVCANSNTRVVFSSSSAIYGNVEDLPTTEADDRNPTSPYGLQKLHCEEYLQMFYDLYGLESVSLRYFNVYGPKAYGDSPYSTAIAAWCQAIHDNKKLRSDGDGEQSRDLVYVDDVVEANILAGLCKSSLSAYRINVASGSRYSNNDILFMLKKRFGDLDINNAPERPGDVKHTLGDPSQAKDLLGFETKISIEKGLDKTLEWWKTVK